MLAGCTATPYKERNLDTTSNFKLPEKGKSGVYVYRYKTFLGRAIGVDFKIKGVPEATLNVGEYIYFEVEPGNYEYLSSGGLIQKYIPVNFEEDQNYFFRVFLLFQSDTAVLVGDQKEIEDAKNDILSRKYERRLLDKT